VPKNHLVKINKIGKRSIRLGSLLFLFKKKDVK
jgi:hypothetical protein